MTKTWVVQMVYVNYNKDSELNLNHKLLGVFNDQRIADSVKKSCEYLMGGHDNAYLSIEEVNLNEVQEID